MIQTIGTSIPTARKGRPPEFNYAEVISIALKSELERDPNRVKLVANWTGAKERTVLNWLDGISGPNGKYLIRLMRRSNAVYEMTLGLAQRPEAIVALYEKLAITDMARRPSTAPTKSAKVHVPNRVPNDPIDDPDPAEMTLRQDWFLQCLLRKPKASCRDIRDFFGVSLKTAKRDIAALKSQGKIVFKGSLRRGRYVLIGDKLSH